MHLVLAFYKNAKYTCLSVPVFPGNGNSLLALRRSWTDQHPAAIFYTAWWSSEELDLILSVHFRENWAAIELTGLKHCSSTVNSFTHFQYSHTQTHTKECAVYAHLQKQTVKIQTTAINIQTLQTSLFLTSLTIFFSFRFMKNKPLWHALSIRLINKQH